MQASRPAAGDRSRLGAWLLAARPPTLTAAATPVVVGTSVAIHADAAQAGPALAALFGALAIQVGANLANDVSDFRRGADTAERIGPPRVTQLGLLSERQVIAGMVAAFGLATLAGLYLVAVAGWPVVAVGVASILAALAYTGGAVAIRLPRPRRRLCVHLLRPRGGGRDVFRAGRGGHGRGRSRRRAGGLHGDGES